MNPIKKYVNTVEWKLRLPWAVRRRIMADLASDITARQEAGESAEQIIAELGPAEQLAASFNEEFGRHTDRKSGWQWVFLAGAALCAGLLLRNFMLEQQMAASIGIIGGADGPTAIYVTWPSFSAWPLLAGFLGAFLTARAGKTASRDLYLAAILVSAGGVVLFAKELLIACKTGMATVPGALLWPQFWLPVIVLMIAVIRRKSRSK